MDNELQNYRATTLNMSLEFIEMLHLYNTCLTKILSKYNLYPGQPQLLITVRDSGNALTQNELAEKIGGRHGSHAADDPDNFFAVYH